MYLKPDNWSPQKEHYCSKKYRAVFVPLAVHNRELQLAQISLLSRGRRRLGWGRLWDRLSQGPGPCQDSAPLPACRPFLSLGLRWLLYFWTSHSDRTAPKELKRGLLKRNKTSPETPAQQIPCHSSMCRPGPDPAPAPWEKRAASYLVLGMKPVTAQNKIRAFF